MTSDHEQPATRHDVSRMDDFQVIAERRRVMTALAQRHDALTREYDRRARAAWRPAETQPGGTRQREQADSAGQQP